MYSEQLQKFIPPDFELAKYEKAANMELVNWIENLTMRFLGYLASENGIETLDELQQKHIQELTQHNVSQGVVLNSPYPAFLASLTQGDKAKYSSVVRDITYFELFYMADALKSDELEKIYSQIDFSIFPLINQNKLGVLNETISIPSVDDDFSWLQIDMNCSDKEIEGAFSDWLKRTRRKRQEQAEKSKSRERKLKIFNKVAFRNWHDARVLAYIDLATWNSLKGNKVTSKIFGDILFPDPKDLSDKTKKVEDTVKSYAAKLTSPDTLRRMVKVLADENRKKITQ